MKSWKGFVFCFCLFALVARGETNPLKFHGGKFRIIQFTDLHWVPGIPEYKEGNCKTLALMDTLIVREKPDLIVFTGDIVVAGPVREGWKTLLQMLNHHRIPFAVTFGNHDFEAGMPVQEILQFLNESPWSVSRSEEGLPGAGNCVLEIRDSAGKNTDWALYMFDSHDYSPCRDVSGYAWIENSQIQWYRKESDRLAADHDNRPLPALAFFHIPLPEYVKSGKEEEIRGQALENVCAPAVNSGLFVSFLEKKDVAGVFVGHDHNNDYLKLHYGIALAYGRKTGFNTAYEEFLPRGARVIVLHENTKAFDTYITTLQGKEQEYFYGK